METEIDRYLKQHEQHLKEHHSKARVQRLIAKDIEKRKILQEHIDDKLRKGEEKRLKKIQDSTRSLADLKKKRQEMQSDKYREQKKQ